MVSGFGARIGGLWIGAAPLHRIGEMKKCVLVLVTLYEKLAICYLRGKEDSRGSSNHVEAVSLSPLSPFPFRLGIPPSYHVPDPRGHLSKFAPFIPFIPFIPVTVSFLSSIFYPGNRRVVEWPAESAICSTTVTIFSFAFSHWEGDTRPLSCT